MANMEEENSMVQSEAETISSEDETPVAAKRRRIEEQEEESNEEETEEEMNCAGMSTQVTHDRNTIKVRASHDFDPKQMDNKEKRELEVIQETFRVEKQSDHLQPESCHADESNESEDEEDFYALPFQRGDIMVAISLGNRSVTDGWLLARHLDNIKVGFIPRNRVVMANIILRATHDFDPEQMNEREDRELLAIIFGSEKDTAQIGHEQSHGDKEYDGEINDNDNEDVIEPGPSVLQKQINSAVELRKSKRKCYSRLTEEKSDHEEVIKMEELKTITQVKGLMEPGPSGSQKQINSEVELRTPEREGHRRSIEEIPDNESEEKVISMEEQQTVTVEKGLIEPGPPGQHTEINLETELKTWQSITDRWLRETISNSDSEEKVIVLQKLKTLIQEKGLGTVLKSKDELSLSVSEKRYMRKVLSHPMALSFKRGEQMETIDPVNISDTDGWWKVKHLESREIGFIPRYRVVIENDHQPRETTLNELPLELLDKVFEKSFLHWIRNPSSHQKNEDVIKSLASVDFCWFQRITRRRFKNRILKRLKVFYETTKKSSAIIRNNRNYLLENIQPSDELIALMLSLNCITEEKCHFIRRQRSNWDKNDKLVYVLRSLDKTLFSNFVKCLRQKNQTEVARIMENGGVVIKVEITNWGTTYRASMDRQLFHQRINNLRDRTKPRSHQTDTLISQLKEKGIEILNSQLYTPIVVVWIWCHSQAALEKTQRLYKSNQLTCMFFGIANFRPPTSEISQKKMINIDGKQFKKKVVVCSISINFTNIIDSSEIVSGVTHLQNEIYILCESQNGATHVILVCEDRNPFRLQKKIEIKEFNSSDNIASSKKENCLYVSDSEEKCVWKLTKETGDQHKVSKWLTMDYSPVYLSVSNDGNVLVVSWKSSILMSYRSDAELIRSIQLTTDIKNPMYPLQAVETSIGNFIVLEEWNVEKKGEGGSSGKVQDTNYGVAEFTRDGQMVIRRFIPLNETQRLESIFVISLDSEDRVFVGDYRKAGVILLDSDLKWNRILCPTNEEAATILCPWWLCYDEENKQLLVGGYLQSEVFVYTLSRK